MKNILRKSGFNKDDIVSYGNMFLLGNGRYGYRGTLEEYTSSEMTSLNVLGLYDKYQDKWRESINLPNPFFIKTYIGDKCFSVLENKPLNHEITLDIFNAVFSRNTEYKEIIIKSFRFLSSFNKNLLVTRYIVKAKEDVEVKLIFKNDLDIYEINGPHFKDKKYKISEYTYEFNGITNEDKRIRTITKYVSKSIINTEDDYLYINEKLNRGDEVVLDIFVLIDKENNKSKDDLSSIKYEEALLEHTKVFNQKWDMARVYIDNKDDQFELDYSIYHLLILEDEDSESSIPARGVSGQTYKGAIFWDTEIFMFPFYLLTNPKFARNLLKYRINTLSGAKLKAKSFNYEGAFYAWESQDTGEEQCSKYNVTDPVTNEPIRTYFDEKQIHISGDIAITIDRYVKITDDYSLLKEGGYEVIYEIAKFYISRSTKRNNKYHFDDVIGPDEYHERINDNAYTNYLIKEVFNIAVNYFDEYHHLTDNTLTKEELMNFKDNIYLPLLNKDGIIEQFDGYYSLSDTHPEEVKKMVEHQNEYLGWKASKTKTIKQADVATLLIILPDEKMKDYLKANYDYYLPYTEHGSSLSSSIYSLLASQINESDNAYKLFKKSAGIDLGTDQKMYAGGIYIGGTHPASNAGAYLSIIFGFCGLNILNNHITLNPHLPKEIGNVSFKFYFKNELYNVNVDRNGYELVMEVNDND